LAQPSTLWIASSNPSKRAELEQLLQPLGYRLRGLDQAPAPLQAAEDAPDFAGNAERKAAALARLVGEPAVADDSGLCVDALGGRPGVHSARYAGPGATDAQRNALLLAELAGIPPERRTARFVCHVCLAAADGSVLARFEGVCEGTIAEAPRGSGGFGYDPLFVAAAYRAVPGAPTFAELAAEQKNAVSHRARALRDLVRHLTLHPLP
jgi:XTP/dITP diphosphohydrolase